MENVKAMKSFCEQFAEPHSFLFDCEDFLYSPESLKCNKLAFLAELFFYFELKPLDCVKDVRKFKAFIKGIYLFIYKLNLDFIGVLFCFNFNF